jgi:hypothetical protein
VQFSANCWATGQTRNQGGLKPKASDDRVARVALDLADDAVPGTHVDLEPDELGAGDPRDDEEPQAAVRRPGQPARRGRQLVREGIVEDVRRGARARWA